MAVVAALLAGAIAVAVRQPSQRLLPALADAAAPDLGAAPSQPLAQVSDTFVADALGDSAYRSLVGAPRVAPAVVSAPAPPSSPRPAAPAPAPAPALRPGRSTGLFAQGSWALRRTMAADRPVVRAGERFSYAMTVKNVGQDRFAGSLKLEWHIPLNTRSTPTCPVDIPIVCPLIAPLFVAPGTGLDAPLGIHLQFFTTGVVIPPGGAFTHTVDFVVNEVVLPAQVITNHAHLTVTGGTGTVTAQAAPVTTA